MAWKHILACTFVVWTSLLVRVASGGDFTEEITVAFAGLETAQQEGGTLLFQGDLEGSTKRLLSVYPESTRTAAQAFVLGNLLFSIEPELSYKLHQRVAKEHPNEP
jgi:hypothetical protein